MLGVIIAVFAILTGCKEEKMPVPPKPRVAYMLAQTNNVPLITELPGRVSAYTVSEVRPQISGVIQKRLFEEGSDVAKDQQLYQIDPALFKAAYDRARADLANARANVRATQLLAERYGKIVDINAVSRQEYDNAVSAHDQAVAMVESARQAVETARINLEYTRVLSPISGRISRSFFTPGALVTQNQAQPLASVQQLSPVYVDVTQSSADILKLRRALARGDIQAGVNQGANVKLLLEDGTPYTRLKIEGPNQQPSLIMGELQFSDVTIDQSAGVVSVRATFENPDYILLPGMYVRAVIEEGVREGAILIPQAALMRDTRNLPIVYVLTKEAQAPPQGVPAPAQADAAAAARSLGDSDFFVAVRPVTVDRDYKNHWIITDGLRQGDRVMVSGFQVARPGQIVTGEMSQPESPIPPAPAVAVPKAADDAVVPESAVPGSDKEQLVTEEKPGITATGESPQWAVTAPTQETSAAPTPVPAVTEVSGKRESEEKARPQAAAPDQSGPLAPAPAVAPGEREKEEQARAKAVAPAPVQGAPVTPAPASARREKREKPQPEVAAPALPDIPTITPIISDAPVKQEMEEKTRPRVATPVQRPPVIPPITPIETDLPRNGNRNGNGNGNRNGNSRQNGSTQGGVAPVTPAAATAVNGNGGVTAPDAQQPVTNQEVAKEKAG